MDDELEDKVLYQTYASYMKFLSKFALGVPTFNSSASYMWKLLRLYLTKPEVIICGLLLVLLVVYLQAVEVWSRDFVGRIQKTLGYTTKASKLQLLSTYSEKLSWEVKKDASACFAIQGRRPRMEDRFIVEENVNSDTGIALFAIFDGHAGDYAADYAKDVLMKSVSRKIIDAHNIILGKPVETPEKKVAKAEEDESNKENIAVDKNAVTPLAQRRSSFRKSYSSFTEDCLQKGNCQQAAPEPDIYNLNALCRPLNKEAFLGQNVAAQKTERPQVMETKCYIESGKINYGKLLTDEVLAADHDLVEAAKKIKNFAGTTALIAVLDGTKLVVANVGDSRGVMCDSKGNAIPLSFDHKPQQVREKKRIQEAGGFVAFNGVWRVAGILATSRAMGDYPLKDKKLVIADPDILTFNLADHKPMFIILASDGLWDTFSNEEAVSFIKDRLDEPHFGAKALTMQSYYRGSVDNISVLVVVFKNGTFRVGSSGSD
ncbi:protein phosphatase 1L [Phlebotomus argentipes]|uniref:protein phosphatase 1L n=1 Tax=Phlebotomus argentipes TaxID=94469 RepID=UPI002892BF46|nr:protein phosphatase 1L [Phlebotomus argentipes]